MFCENLLCKYIQTLFTATNNKWKESFYNKQSGLYNVVIFDGEDIFLQKITSVDVTTMDLKWNSKISTYVALVKSPTQESTVSSRRTKKKTITKSNRSRNKTMEVKKFKQINFFKISIKSYI